MQQRSRSAYATRNLTEGSIPKNLWFLGWPQMVSGAMNAVDNLTDLFWAGFLGSRAIASVGVGQTWIQLFNTGRMGLDIGGRALVSRAVGAEDLPLANHIARQSLIFNMGLNFVVMILGILASDFLLRVLGVSDGVAEEGSAYQRLRFVSSFFFGLTMVTGSLLQAGGDTLTPMKAQMISRVIHIALSPVLIFGWAGIPAEGVSGAAVASAISQAIGGALNLRALFGGSSRISITMKDFRFDGPALRQQIRIGAPASVTSAERSLAQVILVGLAAPFGSTGLAVYSILQRIEMFGGFGAMGLAQAAGIIVGQSLGARRPERAKATVWWTLGWTGMIQVVVCGSMFIFAEQVIRLFSRDTDVIDIGVPWMHIAVLGFVLFSSTNVLVQALNTAGDTMIPMAAGLVSLWGVQQPIAIILTGAAQTVSILGFNAVVPAEWNLGIIGIAWGILIAAIVRYLGLFLYFLWGPWWKREVLATSPWNAADEPEAVRQRL